ncbi:MAG TPA: hypothetical protein VFD38_17980 [Myxococcaceae bacterium]|nr:hypothetical protein [Myxococcaceae bacterium]
MEPSRMTVCSRCARQLVCTEDLGRWLRAVARAGARVYCSLACSAASESLELTGDLAFEVTSQPLQP